VYGCTIEFTTVRFGVYDRILTLRYTFGTIETWMIVYYVRSFIKELDHVAYAELDVIRSNAFSYNALFQRYGHGFHYVDISYKMLV